MILLPATGTTSDDRLVGVVVFQFDGNTVLIAHDQEVVALDGSSMVLSARML